ncbi:tetratricopeptide repeat protein [Roseiflexus castenholzii]|jgi:tetratricopeptide (TPR) repeat protein|uniref:TPR repeat-containing protein n=1 Tax=Roseiflexus castenholzii (strain DSM 13941 / HLO8) TaxID=383372 RepID=A7NGW2_ROSCS|nr:tetratricopeptide repeat protein [Roseiflexus castenholzii]ABU56709.1 TPR repeat-containing protein [Roseiflexus castenholzii DSM 13941]
MKQRTGRCVACIALVIVLAACSEPLVEPRAPRTPTAVIDRYNAIVATAEAGDDLLMRARAYYDRGNIWFEQQNYIEAIADYDRALALDPSMSRAFHNRGLAYALLKEYDAALRDYAQAIHLDPAYRRAYENRVRLLEELTASTPDETLLQQLADDYGSLARLIPEAEAPYRYRQGLILVRLNDRTAAREAFDAAIRARPQHVDALYERALLHYAVGDLNAALADLDTALRLSPRAANAYYARGLIRHTQGDPRSAIADFGQALLLRPDYPEALIARAATYAEQGNITAARADLKRLDELQLDPALQPAREALRIRINAP